MTIFIVLWVVLFVVVGIIVYSALALASRADDDMESFGYPVTADSTEYRTDTTLFRGDDTVIEYEEKG